MVIDCVTIAIHAVECEGGVESAVHDASRPGGRRNAAVYFVNEVLHTGYVGGTKVSYYSAYSGVSLSNYLHGIHQWVVCLFISLTLHLLIEFVLSQFKSGSEGYLVSALQMSLGIDFLAPNNCFIAQLYNLIMGFKSAPNHDSQP